MPMVPQRYRQQTDGQTTYDSNIALALRASHGKNSIAIYRKFRYSFRRYVRYIDTHDTRHIFYSFCSCILSLQILLPFYIARVRDLTVKIYSTLQDINR